MAYLVYDENGQEFEIVRYCRCGWSDAEHVMRGLKTVRKNPKTGRVIQNQMVYTTKGNTVCERFREKRRVRIQRTKLVIRMEKDGLVSELVRV